MIILLTSQSICIKISDEVLDDGGLDFFVPKNSGIDIKPNSVSFNYPSSTDQDKYQMFSSNYPIQNFNKPADLFVIDAMLGVEIRMTIELENTGSNSSGLFPVRISVEHDEYAKFELMSTTINSPSINPGSTGTIQYTWTPTYSGNHSLIIEAQHPTDINSANDFYYRHMTVGKVYHNCDDFTSWSVGSSWSSNADASISKGVSCHIGNGATSNYGNGISSILSTPVWDFSDRHPNPSRAVGLSLFATGSAQAGDTISIQAKKVDGTWNEFGLISGSIDPTVADGTSTWTTFTNTIGSHSLPLIGLNSDYLHSTSQFRYVFSSDNSGTDIGYWLDELVWYYDQKAGLHEYDWRIGTSNQSSTQRGDWSDQSVTIHNDGNVSDRYVPNLNSIPSDWEYTLLHENGGNIDMNSGVQVLPGESHNLRIKIKPGPSASVGLNQYQLQITSMNEGSITDFKDLEITVDPSYIPHIVEQNQPAVCSSGNSCEFFIEVENIGEGLDSFDIIVTPLNVLEGWTLGLAWDQQNSITIAPNQSEMVKFVVSVPPNIDPDLISSVWLEVSSNSDPTRVNSSLVKAKSAMVTIADVGLDYETWSGVDWSILPGESTDVTFTVWNNASRLDIFSIGVDKNGGKTWSVSQPSVTTLAVNPGSSSTFTISVHSPTTAQVGDPGPIITPWATSTLSGNNATSIPFNEISVAAVYDINISKNIWPENIRPGTPTIFGVEIQNNGNGPVSAVITIDGISSDWSWSMVVDDEIVYNPILLSPSYELNDIEYIEVVLNIPQEIGPGEDISVEISVNPEIGVDSNPSDNTAVFELATIGVKKPEISSFNTSTQLVKVSESMIIDFQIFNIGNVADPFIKVKFQTQTLPQTDGITVTMYNAQNPILYVSGGEWLSVPIMASSNASIQILIEVASHVQVGTNMALSIIVEGGEDDNGGLVQLTTETVVNVYERRDVSIEFMMNNTAILGHSEDLEIIVWSNSSVAENLQFNPTIPEDWNLQCDGVSASQGYSFTVLASDGMRPSSSKILCKLIDGGDAGSGTIKFNISNSEGEKIYSESLEFSFEKEKKDSGEIFMGLDDPKTIVLGIVILSTMIAVTLLILARRRGLDEDSEVEEEIYGPPATISNNTQFVTEQRVVQPEQVAQDPMITQVPYEELIDGFTVAQLRAAGWSDEQIDWKRKQELENAENLNNAFSALE